MPVSVLVAHDNRDALALLLRVLGYRVAVTSDARQALAAALGSPPDYLLAGLADGPALAREVRRHPALNATVLVAVSDPAHRAQALAAGFHHCVSPAELHKVLLPPWLTRARTM
jgi:CheY-like chemotaxis protein